MALKLYNTLTNKKEIFEPVEPGKVKFYMCGPTVYDYIHIGNARAFIVFDALRRLLRYLGYEVTYVMNLTDIDDRIIERSLKEKIAAEEITARFSQAFFEDLQVLGVEPADVYPKATEHISEIISLIQSLVDNGIAYQVNGDVFYDVSKFDRYGGLSGKKIEELKAGSRVAVDEKKRNPLDFALWKSQKPSEPAWESPWGPGRPGWHIECSAMSMKHLGETFDIHAGGVDLVFPHHENEIAQSEAATGKKFVRYWLHNGFLKIEGDKMAKSLGNFKTVREICSQFPSEVLRLFFFQKHYRSPIDFTHNGLMAAKSAVSRLNIFYKNLVRATEGLSSRLTPDPEKLLQDGGEFVKKYTDLKKEMLAALEDDFNTPVAVSKLFDIVRESNKILNKVDRTDVEKSFLLLLWKDFEDINSVLGIATIEQEERGSELLDELMRLLIEIRNELRKKQEWKLSDKIRDQLDKANIVLEDKPDGTNWRIR